MIHNKAITIPDSRHMKWPTQGRPHKRTFPIWQKAIAHSLSLHQNRLPIKNKLGDWTSKQREFDIQWQSFWSPSTGLLYIQNEDRAVEAFKNIYARFNHRRFDIEPLSTIEILPNNSIPIDVIRHKKWMQISIPKFVSSVVPESSLIELINEDDDQMIEVNQEHITPWKTWLDSQEQWKKNLLEITEFKEYRINERECDTNNKSVLIATDGGLKDDEGSYRAVISQGNMILAVTKDKTPLAPDMHSSHRAECYGMFYLKDYQS